MNAQNAVNSTLAMAMTSAIAFCQQAGPQIVTTRAEGFAAILAVPSPLLELRLAHRDVTRLELRGGTPGAPAHIALGRERNGPPATGSGSFDSHGCFSIAVDLATFAGDTFVGQGFAAAPGFDGWQLLASNGLQVEVPVLAPATPIADFSLLRIELDPHHGEAAWQELTARDFVGALDILLDSPGDSILAKVQGKLLVVVPGTPIQLGGSVGYSAQISRDGDDYLVAIGAEVAVLCGVKATKGVGMEGGVSLGADQIHRFHSPAEVARGLFGIAMQQVLPNVLAAANSENLAKVRHLRATVANLFAAGEALRNRRVCRLPAVERALDAALGAARLAYGRARRVGDFFEHLASQLVAEAEFVRRHVDGTEMRIASTGEVSLEIGGKKLGGTIGAELGGKASGGYQLTVRTFQTYGEEPARVELAAAHSISAAFAAGVELGELTDGDDMALGRGIEVSLKVSRGLQQVWERHHGELRRAGTTVVITRELGLPGFGRKTTFACDAVQLAGHGLEAVTAAIDRDAGATLGALAGIEVAVTVQDRRIKALKPEFGVENTGITAKIGGEFSWSDCGPQRGTVWSLQQVVERLADVEARRAEVAELMKQLRGLAQQD